MSLKKRGFRNLRQGNHTVGQYVDEFSQLAPYAPDDVAIDAAKQEKFLEGLNDELGMQLMVATFNNYQELVDKAIIFEGKQQQIDSRKRKYGHGKYSSGAQHKPRYTPYSGGHNHHTHGGHTHRGHTHSNSKSHKNGNGGNGTQHNSTPVMRDPSTVTYFRCKQIGHYANKCPDAKPSNGNGN